MGGNVTAFQDQSKLAIAVLSGGQKGNKRRKVAIGERNEKRRVCEETLPIRAPIPSEGNYVILVRSFV